MTGSSSWSTGREAGGYRLLEPLGRGPFCETWKAVDRGGREVAIKVAVHPRYAAALAERGPKLLAPAHDCLVRTVEIRSAEDPPSVVSEYVPATSLREFLVESDPFGSLAAVRILSQVLSGVEALHRAGRPHGALKSKNVLLAHNGRVLLSDAEVGSLTKHLTIEILSETGDRIPPEVAALLPYLAEEDLRIPGGRNLRGDLFSAGILLFEMLSGRTPDLSAEEPWTASQVPPALAGVLRRLLAPLEARHDSASECLHELALVEGRLRPEPATSVSDSSRLLVPVAAPRRAPEGKGSSAVEDGSKPELDVVPRETSAPREETGPRLERKILRWVGTGSHRFRKETARGYVETEEEGEVFFPVALLRELAWCLGLLSLLFLLVSVVPRFSRPEPGVPAGSARSPERWKPEWYFLPLYELSNVGLATGEPAPSGRDRVGVLAVIAGVLALVLLPFWDRSRAAGRRARVLFHPFVFAVVGEIAGLAIAGAFHPDPPFGIGVEVFLAASAGAGLIAGAAWEVLRAWARAAR
ncbi:MAG: protein kinase [Planctomycetes bacterium]|nr:protein kinase [Planctomycetota bacterium]